MRTISSIFTAEILRGPFLINGVARVYGFVFLWHAVRHFCSYALLGSQSFFSNPRMEWIILGALQLTVSVLLLRKPKSWHLIAAALVLFLCCTAYPVGRHVGDSAFLFLLLGLAMVMLAGDGWIPLATLPSVIGLTLAAIWKIHGGRFSICDLTHCMIVRYPWMDWFNTFLTNHETLSKVLSDLVMIVELSALCIWALLFFPSLWLLRSILALMPISLLFGIGITGNLDEFPWIMLTAWLLMLGPKRSLPQGRLSILVYALAFVLYTACLFNLEINIRRIYSNETEFVFEKHIGLLPQERLKQMTIFMLAPYWNMYAGPIARDQLFGGQNAHILQIQNHIKSQCGCGMVLNRWERIYWERIGRCLKDTKQHDAAKMLMTRYQLLEGEPCSTVAFPPPFPPVAHAKWITDYKSALISASNENKLVLLEFTGSDWCTACQLFDKEVLSQSTFLEFVDTNYVGVTHDYPHEKPQAEELKEQNARLAEQFGVDKFPTLIVINADGKELGRSAGYEHASGPDSVISKLMSFP